MIHIPEHEGPKVVHDTELLFTQACRPASRRMLDHIPHQGVDALLVGPSQKADALFRQIIYRNDTAADGIVNVMIDVGDTVAGLHHLPFQGERRDGTGVVEDAVPDFFCKIQPPPVRTAGFQHIHHPQTLHIVAEAAGMDLVQDAFSGMPEGGVPQVVPHGDGLRQVLIESASPGDGPGDLRHLDGVGQPGPEMIPLRSQEHLGLVHETAKGFGMDDPVPVPLIDRTEIALVFRHPPAPALIRFRSVGRKDLVFSLLDVLSRDHSRFSQIIL